MVSAKRKPLNTWRFIHTTSQSFADQYYHIYNARLKCAREALIEQSRSRWGRDVKCVPLEQLNGSLGNTDVFVIGTLFKVMPRQPSILRELESNEALIVDPKVRFISDEDSLVLHETDENVQVVGDIDIHSHVTGIPVSLLGHQLNGGAKFHVVDACYAGLNLNVYDMPPKNSYSDTEKGEQILIVSGFEFGFDSSLPKDRCVKVVEALKKLRSFILGDTSGSQHINSMDIKKIIVAGNSVAPGYTKAKTELIGGSESKDGRTLDEVFQLFDNYLFTLAQSGADVDLMPGRTDPASFLLPQQPFHPKILPKSGLLENVHPRTNPMLIEYKDITILGTSGENIDAIRQHSNIEYSTTILKNTLEWGHIAPCAPDNLSCVPFKESDPFLIDFVPDIYFAGNQSEYIMTTYCTDTKSKIQLISVPSFVQSLSCVVINTSNLDCDLLTFSD